MSSKYAVIGDHAETLASGRRVAPGDELPASALDTTDPGDQRLLDEGVVIELAATKKEST